MKSTFLKTTTIISLFILSLIINACSTPNNALFNNTWELEFISGPRIAFEGLYPDKKPIIALNKTTGKAEGTNSCNGYSADYTLDGETLSFGEPGPTTMMFCGNGETVFLNTMKKINRYTIDTEGKLNLLVDDVTMMRFKKMSKE